MKDIGDMDSSCWSLRLVIIAAAFSAAPTSCEKDDGPPLNGQCGLSGQKVWCIENRDCVELGLGTYCNEYGNCCDGGDLEYECSGYMTGTECFIPVGSVCNHAAQCAFPCETHADCPDGQCNCFWDLSICSYFRCPAEGSCLDHTLPKDRTLICVPKPEYLEGECHGYRDGTCDASYIPVGEKGCIRIQ